MPPLLIAIVLHGAGPYYLDPLFAAGRLPHLQQLIAEGHRRSVESAQPLAAGAWVTMLTGESAGVHGVVDYCDLDARAYDGLAGRFATSDDYRDRTVQSVWSRAGLRIASIYLPMTQPPWPVNGIMISGFPLPDERRPPTYPPDLANALPPLSDRKLFGVRYDRKDLVDGYLRYNLGQLETLTRDACRGGRFDVVLGCLPTPDLAHHYLWRPDDPEALERIYSYYELVDDAIGRVIAEAGDQTTVTVFSDHGGRAAPTRTLGINRWLADAGYLARGQSALSGPGAVAFTNRVVDWMKTHRINHALASRIRGPLRRRVSAMTHNTSFVDWSRTRAYGLDFFCPLAGVEINLRGRQTHGVVPPAEYEGLCAEIRARLEDTTDPDTGARVFARVCRRDELFHGPHLDRFPDVIGVLDDAYDVKPRLHLPIVGPNPGQADYPFMGYHGHEAFFAVRGPGIRAGSIGPASHVIDFAPTLLALSGVTPPASMEGRPFEY